MATATDLEWIKQTIEMLRFKHMPTWSIPGKIMDNFKMNRLLIMRPSIYNIIFTTIQDYFTLYS